MIQRLLILLAALLGWAAPAAACSVSGDYVRPSNFELVQIAGAIVVATPVAATGEHKVRFHVEQIVKGAPPSDLELDWAAIGQPPPSNLDDLSTSNPEGYQGPCNRMQFVVGQHYLLFINRGADGQWRQLGFPFSRINEDYRGENTIWMRTVRRYLALQQRLAPMAQLDALAAMQASGRAPDGSALAPQERRDISEHFASVSEWKPTEWLLGIYARAERGEPVATRPASANREGGEADALTSLVFGDPDAGRPQGSAGVRIAVLDALAAGSHPAAMPLFDRLAAAPGTGPRERAAILRYYARNGRFADAWQWIETRLMTQLVLTERSDAMRLLADVADVMQGEASEEAEARWSTDPDALEREARWRRDPHALATWPELALALYWYQVRTFGEDHAIDFRGAIGAIPVTDFRARPLLTLALTRQFDTRVVDWAIAELAHPPAPPVREVYGRERLNDPAILPLRVLAGNPTPASRAALVRIFCEGGPRRRLAIFALGQWGHDLYGDLLTLMAAFPRLEEDDRYQLRLAAIELAARRIDEDGALQLGAEEDAWLVTRLLSRRPPPPPILNDDGPVTCPA